MARNITTETYTTPEQVLVFPHPYTAVPQVFSQNSPMATTIGGRQIIPMGFIFPANDATAQGIVMRDIDVTDGDYQGPIILEGYIHLKKLPTAPSEAARTAMPKIKFMPYDKPTT